MFIKNPRTRDFRYWMINPDDKVGKSILTAAKSAATKEYKGTHTATTRDLLRKRMSALDTEQLNVLYCIYMIVHPTAHAGSTGAGGIWAWASRIVNEVASEILAERPAFELID